MKCLHLFSGKNEKNVINLSSAELAQRVSSKGLCFCIYHAQTNNRALCHIRTAKT